ncbi:MAG: hypothetical protein V4585_16385 [Bacteroidota bacterium]|jgi:hypothetical protein
MKKTLLLLFMTIMVSTLHSNGQVNSIHDKWNLFTLDLKDGLPPWIFEKGDITIEIRNEKITSKGLGFKTVGKVVDTANSITFTNLKTDKIFCNEPEKYKAGTYGNNRKKIDPIFLKLLEEADHFKVNGDKLYLLKGNEEIASFEKSEPREKSVWIDK